MQQLVLSSFLLFFLPSLVNAGKAIYLDVDGEKCQAIYQAKQYDKSYGGVVLAAKRIDPVLEFLQQDLAKLGWASVAVAIDAKCDNGQLAKAISYLRQQKLNRIIALYYGTGVTPFMQSFNQAKGTQINGIVLLSAFDINVDKEKSIDYEKWQVPTFDIVGQLDYTPVLQQWKERGNSIHDKNYTALKLLGAEHDYADSKQVLVNWLTGWMKKQAKTAVRKPPIQRR